MQATAFMPELCPFYNKVANSDQVPDLADLGGNFCSLVKGFNFFMQEVKPFHRAAQPYIRPYNAHIVTHQQLQFFKALGDEDHLFGGRGAFSIPIRYLRFK